MGLPNFHFFSIILLREGLKKDNNFDGIFQIDGGGRRVQPFHQNYYFHKGKKSASYAYQYNLKYSEIE